MSRKNESITLAINSTQKENLEQIALELGFMWGNKPNISALLVWMSENASRCAYVLEMVKNSQI